MRVDELSKFGIDQVYIEKFKEMKINELYPPQAEAIKKGLLKGKNLLLSVPTAAGKTLVAILAIINKLSKSKCKAVYIVPLVALANEKFELMKKIFSEKYKVAISVGDLDDLDPWLKEYDIIIVTAEKLDSLIRHGADWLYQIGLIIADEIHILQDPSRGPTFEILLTKLRLIAPTAQILALSASVKNAEEIAKWLDANLVMSDFRPVKLYEGICYNHIVKFLEKEGYELDKELTTEEAIAQNTLKQNWQALFFTSTRKRAESLAEKISYISERFVTNAEKKILNDLSSKIVNVLEVPTTQCKKLGRCIKNGVAFHHAGLLGKQKILIEESFKKGLIKIICCTPTLAMGISFPADRVVFCDAKRYYPGVGTVYMPILDYHQMKGRAGRPEWSPYGESILIAKTEEDAQEMIDHFILGELENIQSKLAAEAALRTHILALFANNFCKTENSLLDFFSKTFFAFQYGDTSLIEEKILMIVDQLNEWKFIERKGKTIAATRVGKRVSELYIDPLTAYHFITRLNKASKKEVLPFSFLQTICNTLEMQPLLSIKTGEFAELNEIIAEREPIILQEIPKEWELEFDEFLKSIKTALMFESWINEAREEEILTKFKVTPGEFYTRKFIADWLVYALQELALILGYKELLKDLRKLRIRLEYGVKEELIPLVRLRGIGRVRARKLFSAGINSLQKLREIPLDRLSMLVGQKVAQNIKQQVEKRESEEDRQTTLTSLK